MSEYTERPQNSRTFEHSLIDFIPSVKCTSLPLDWSHTFLDACHTRESHMWVIHVCHAFIEKIYPFTYLCNKSHLQCIPHCIDTCKSQLYCYKLRVHRNHERCLSTPQFLAGGTERAYTTCSEYVVIINKVNDWHPPKWYWCKTPTHPPPQNTVPPRYPLPSHRKLPVHGSVVQLFSCAWVCSTVVFAPCKAPFCVVRSNIEQSLFSRHCYAEHLAQRSKSMVDIATSST